MWVCPHRVAPSTVRAACSRLALEAETPRDGTAHPGERAGKLCQIFLLKEYYTIFRATIYTSATRHGLGGCRNLPT